MLTVIKLSVFTVLSTLFYLYVGQMVPQKEVHPPKEVEVSDSMDTTAMISAGQKIVEGKGTCLGCHTPGLDKPGRFPDLGGVGDRAATQKEGMSGLDYLAESLFEPNKYIVPGFNPGMPAVHKPPISLNQREILTVLAYLQSLGGNPSVGMDTQLKYVSNAGSSENKEAAKPEAQTPPQKAPEMTPKTMLTTYLCNTCHSLDTPARMVGPSLFDIGNRLDENALFESILAPDATVAATYPPGIMSAMLNNSGFYEKVSTKQLKELVKYLSSMKGEAK